MKPKKRSSAMSHFVVVANDFIAARAEDIFRHRGLYDVWVERILEIRRKKRKKTKETP